MNKIIERFNAKWIPEPNTGCWLWIGSLNSKGYAVIQKPRMRGKYIQAHRLSYQIHVGEIPEGAHICHKCDTPACVNPNHLFVGNDFLNQSDKCKKGRHHNQKKTQCKYGHELEASNLAKTKDGSRKCLKCKAISSRENYWRKKLHA